MGTHNPYDDTDLRAEIAVIDTIVDDIQGTVNDIETDVAAVQATVDAIPTLTETGGTLTADGSEQNVYINNAPAGIFRPVCVQIDFTNHTATETVVLRTYYRITDGGALIQQDEEEFIGVPAMPLINIELEPNRYGVQVTLEKTAGTNRAYLWEAFYSV